MYSLSTTVDKIVQPLYRPEILSYWRVSSPCAPVSVWLFDVAEIGKHWLSSESLGNFTSLYHRPSCRVLWTFHGYNTGSTDRPIGTQTCPPLSTMFREDKHVC